MRRQNPFMFRTVPAAMLCAVLYSCAATTPGPATGEGPGGGGEGIRGTLTFEGRPLKDAYVYAYRSYKTNLLGPADFASSPSAANGSYTVDLVKGAYYIVARKRGSGENTGPITPGDLYTVNPSNPVAVGDGSYSVVDLELVRMRDPMFFQAVSREEARQGIMGTILDKEGRPVPWVFAMAYTTKDMKRIPELTSVMTGPDGKYVIYVPEGGTYWVAARKNIREKPVSGEPYGLYTGTPDHTVKVPAGGFIEGIDIRLESYHKGIQN